MRDWEACYRSRETPWDKGHAAPPLLELIERLGSGLWGGGTVLVPGCGFGHDVRALSSRGLRALGLDISPSAVEAARTITPVSDESFETGDFLSPDWRRGRVFSAIWEHTCFCAIDPSLRRAYAESAAAVLPPEGVLAGVFYLNPHDPGDNAPGPPFGVTIHELDEQFGPWFSRVDGWIPTMTYPSREGREWIGIYRRLEQPRVAG